ncbi:ATP-binding cassette domain-containing protein [Streptomyces reniochalinae]|uniref:ATP-binding cassette domain-containing protein n=1 Tax=Streptomyces reniochalinae TaxID=2250578 RepID=A0A367F5V3_9ACTN|nr:ATP-binding cassette domain-containing protein [Streptomyces reniochalinae]RCG25713.1 ATP-binding cassette domain-containing protein [Streptomyces reniochalinae]
MPTTVSPSETAPTRYAHHIQAQALTVRRGRRTAVDGIDLNLGTGVHGVLGPNGAGKTTLIRTLATVLTPHSGDLELLGSALRSRGELRALRRQLGYLPQTFGHYPRFTLREFVAYMAWLKEVPRHRMADAVQHAIDRVDLTDRAEDRMGSLSGGMLRRAGIAQAIVNDPAILLLDEPTVGLDPAQRMEFRTLLRDIGEQSCVLVSTHLVEDVGAACAGVVLMDEGRTVFAGPLDHLRAAGSDTDQGDSAIERGYTALLRRHPANQPEAGR